MKANIDGIACEGTPEEISEFKKLTKQDKVQIVNNHFMFTAKKQEVDKEACRRFVEAIGSEIKKMSRY
jgi:hypothetical protein